MTIWVLRCTVCKSKTEVNLGYNLYEFKKIYLFCKKCGKNTFHEIIGHKE